MPITYHIDRQRRLVVARGWGTFTETDALGYQREVWSRPDVAGFDELMDMGAVTEIAMAKPPSAAVQNLAETAVAMDTRGGTKFAIVAPTDLAFGLGRMYQTYRSLDPRSAKRVEVFRTLAEALQFLGHDSVDLPAASRT